MESRIEIKMARPVRRVNPSFPRYKKITIKTTSPSERNFRHVLLNLSESTTTANSSLRCFVSLQALICDTINAAPSTRQLINHIARDESKSWKFDGRIYEGPWIDNVAPLFAFGNLVDKTGGKSI